MGEKIYLNTNHKKKKDRTPDTSLERGSHQDNTTTLTRDTSQKLHRVNRCGRERGGPFKGRRTRRKKIFTYTRVRKRVEKGG